METPWQEVQRAFLDRQEVTVTVSKIDWLGCLEWLIHYDCVVQVKHSGPNYRVTLVMGPSARKYWNIKSGQARAAIAQATSCDNV